MIYSKGVKMNILDIKEAKIKSYLKYLYDHGATTKKKVAKIEDVKALSGWTIKCLTRLQNICLRRGIPGGLHQGRYMLPNLGLAN